MGKKDSLQEMSDAALDAVNGGNGGPRVQALEARYDRQIERINQGVSAGTLSADTAASLIQSEQALYAQLEATAAQNGGGLNGPQYNNLVASFNQLSASIYDSKHCG